MSEIISETRYMEQLNFSLPEIARNVSLQEEKYIRYVNGLKQMLKRYNSIVANLNHAEVIYYYQMLRTIKIFNLFYQLLNMPVQ